MRRLGTLVLVAALGASACGSTDTRLVAPAGASSARSPTSLGSAPAAGSAASACPAGAVRVDGGAYAESKRGLRVAVAVLCVGAHEVTVAEYARCVRDARCAPPYDTAAWPLADAGALESASAACNAHHAERGDHPINCVDWAQAAAYCAYLGMRLPSDEEWEWLARGGARGASYPWGDEPPSAERVCAGRASTCEVEARTDSAPAVTGLLGNVWEWTSSFADARRQLRSFRGGGFSTPLDGLASWPRSAFPEDARTEVIGVRCVSDAR